MNRKITPPAIEQILEPERLRSRFRRKRKPLTLERVERKALLLRKISKKRFTYAQVFDIAAESYGYRDWVAVVIAFGESDKEDQ